MPEPYDIEDEYVFFERNGEKVAAILMVIPEKGSAAVREGIARRRLIVTEGKCPCGAVWEPPVKDGNVMQLGAQHERGCPAIDEILRKNWQRDQRRAKRKGA
ncbi:hypothetical protein [Tsukamurella tyrosinosolvens]|uniref:hypothetical protein n=1 Tax=Tsukamurella tyrosinosolvens TaxID=57704 RepID=UPI002DD44039|nr:hypothetical protein [Tsukamurella tyrosinosolvens]MEC4611816.1 hypothetical protein [Tsukamurella tyrosinosolvens]